MAGKRQFFTQSKKRGVFRHQTRASNFQAPAIHFCPPRQKPYCTFFYHSLIAFFSLGLTVLAETRGLCNNCWELSKAPGSTSANTLLPTTSLQLPVASHSSHPGNSPSGKIGSLSSDRGQPVEQDDILVYWISPVDPAYFIGYPPCLLCPFFLLA